MFLKQQIGILEWFLKDHMTENWTNGCRKLYFAITEIKYILKYIKVENSYFKSQL